MEGRESQARVEAPRSFTAAKPPTSVTSSIKKMKKGRRRVLADLTNSDSPIAGLTPASLCMATCDVGSPVSISSPGTPGMGEDILRSQVQLLLQQVQLDAPRAPIFGSLLDVGVPCSPGMLVGPTPANTPSMSQPSTPVVGSKSRLSRTFYAFQGSPVEESGELGPDSSPETDDSVEEGTREEVDLNGNICKGSKLSGELPLRRAISEISKITIAETVISGRQISLSDRYITRSLDFDSLLTDMTEREAKEDSLSTPNRAPTKLEERCE